METIEALVNKYGPFANTMAIAGFLVAAFAGLLFKMMGKINRWTWFTNTSPFMTLLPARLVAIALMAVSYVLINADNYIIFLCLAIVFAGIGFNRFSVFNKLRIIHVMEVTEVGPSGQQLMESGKPVKRSIVIGTEQDMMPNIQVILHESRRLHPHLTIRSFMSGFGGAINDPFAIWEARVLADVSNKLTMALVYIMLCAVMMIYLSSLSVSVWLKTV